MGKTKFIILLVVAIVIFGGVFWAANILLKQQENTQKVPGTTTDISEKPRIEIVKPWIEVVKPEVAELKSDKTVKRILQTGDELDAGAIVKVNDGGLANIYFLDGSVARLDSKTEITMVEGSFNPQTETRIVKILLTIGRVWSKVFEFSTPESAWEVKTANAVATVRGTAFGMEYLENRSRVIGSENKVSVAAVDPKTKEAIKEAEVIVSADKFVELKDEDVAKIIAAKSQATQKVAVTGPTGAAGTPRIAVEAPAVIVKDAPVETLNADWVKDFKEADAEVNRKIEDLKDSGKTGQELRKEFRKSVQESFESDIQERMLESEKINIDLKIEPKIKESKTELAPEKIMPETTKIIEPSPKLAPLELPKTGTPLLSPLKPQKLIIDTKNNLSYIQEGDRVIFAATFVMSDGIKKGATDLVEWKVVGPIGFMDSPGIFVAKLDSSVSEWGEGLGSVAVIWRDKITGATITGNSPIFKVNAKVEKILNTEG